MMTNRRSDQGMTLTEAALARADNFINGVPCPVVGENQTYRGRIAANFCHISLEHHAGIATLVQQQLITPAIALFRPQLEAWLRALWARWVAPDEKLEEFVKGSTDFCPSPRHIILALPREDKYGGLLESFDKQWEDLCDLTHGGSLQLQLRDHDDCIETRMSDEAVAALVNNSVQLSYFALIELAEILNDAALGDATVQAYKDNYELQSNAAE